MTSQAPMTRTDRLRELTRAPLDRCGAIGARLGLHPDWITLLGLILVALASLLIARGQFLSAGLLLLLSLPLDALDGAVARAMGRDGAFGMLLDSTLDRYADALILAAFSYYFAEQERADLMILALAALIGAFLVSYVKARADDPKVGVDAAVGLFTRLERSLALLIMTMAAGALESVWPLEIGLLILAAGANLTALQRLRYVYATLKDRGD